MLPISQKDNLYEDCVLYWLNQSVLLRRFCTFASALREILTASRTYRSLVGLANVLWASVFCDTRQWCKSAYIILLQ